MDERMAFGVGGYTPTGYVQLKNKIRQKPSVQGRLIIFREISTHIRDQTPAMKRLSIPFLSAFGPIK
jgi:hypothetical protein